MAKIYKRREQVTKIQRRMLFSEAAIAGFSLLIVSIFFVSSLDTLIIRSDQYAGVLAAVLVDLANGDRASNNIGALKMNPMLVSAAQAKADDMAANGYFAHTSPEGRDSWYWFKKAGYSFTYAGENLAVDFSDSADVEKAWMNSPTHRDNILNGHFTEIGIATAVGTYRGHTAVFAVQMFGAPASGRVQDAVQEKTSPKNPTEPAIASTNKDTVLGATVAKVETKLDKALTGHSVEVGSAQAPLWSHIVASPRQSLRFAYYLVAAIIIVLLAVAVGWEIHQHHLKQARAAALLIALMFVLVLFAETYMFSSPVIADSVAIFVHT